MKGSIIPLLILFVVCSFIATALYVVGLSYLYLTVGCIAPGDCLISATTSLWVVAAGFAIFGILCGLGALGIAIWEQVKR